MKNKNLFKRLFLICVFIVFEIILLIEIDLFYKKERNKVLEQNLQNVESQFNAVNKTLNDLANSSFKGFINRNDIKKAFANRDREKLYELLNDNYTYLTSLGFKQVHFHLPNNVSFLRMHKPNKFGDDLSSFRYTVNYTNKYKKSINGFEVGRVLPGIRNLYPLFYDGKYIGSVEMSFSIEKLEKAVEEAYKVYTDFLIKRDKFQKIVFDEDKSKYDTSLENKNYVVLKRKEDNLFFKNIVYSDENIKYIEKNISTQKPFNLELSLGHDSDDERNHIHFIVSFLPVVNVQGNDNMYFVFYKQSINLKLIENSSLNKKILFSIMLIGSFLFLYMLLKNRELTLNSKELVEKERLKYKNLMNLATDGIHIIDEDGNIYETNQTFADMLGYDYEEIKKLNVRDFDATVSTKEEIIKKINLLIKKPEVFNTKHKRKDGSIFYAQINAKGLNIDGKVYLYASSRDVTKQREEYRKLERFIDLQDNIIIVTDSMKLNFANKRFFEFFGFKTIKQFNERFDSICDLFVGNDRFFHLGKLTDEENWIEYLEKLPHSERIVGMLKSDYNLYAFAVTVNKFEDNYYILSFTNITQTMLNHIKLENKTIRDKLTNAFNREYFEQNSESIISDFTKNSFTLGVAFLDIDHFKSVNDTYGHDVGDDVLINFVKVVKKFSREEDILIRWGGEEFILLLKIASHDSLEKALEHIRKVIELEKFNTIGNLTCSIGATLYLENEDIFKTIKRADEAVYKAKNNGRNKVEIF